MSAAYSCDACGILMKHPGDWATRRFMGLDAHDRWPINKVKIPFAVATDGTGREQHVCLDCVKQVFANGYFGVDLE